MGSSGGFCVFSLKNVMKVLPDLFEIVQQHVYSGGENNDSRGSFFFSEDTCAWEPVHVSWKEDLGINEWSEATIETLQKVCGMGMSIWYKKDCAWINQDVVRFSYGTNVSEITNKIVDDLKLRAYSSNKKTKFKALVFERTWS